jgi:hypothetical protein
MELKDEWLTPGGAADWLGVPLDAVHLAIGDGGVPVLTVGGHVRISRGALLALARGGAIANGAVASASEPAELLPNLPAPAGFAWVEQLSPAKGFVHGWPKHGGGYYEEPYPEAWAALITIRGQDQHVKVGRASGAGRKDKRPRLTMFMEDVPFAEFIPTADGTKIASVIKPNGKETIANMADLPPLYRRVPTAPYSAITGLAGIGRPKGLALLIEPDDLRSAVHHAAARRLGRLGEPVVPAG